MGLRGKYAEDQIVISVHLKSRVDNDAIWLHRQNLLIMRGSSHKIGSLLTNI